jgi:hypothetical protein
MPSNLGFLASAYVLVLGSIAAYGLWLRARRARARLPQERAHGAPDAMKSLQRAGKI